MIDFCGFTISSSTQSEAHEEAVAKVEPRPKQACSSHLIDAVLGPCPRSASRARCTLPSAHG